MQAKGKYSTAGYGTFRPVYFEPRRFWSALGRHLSAFPGPYNI